MTSFMNRTCTTCGTVFSIPVHEKYIVNGGIELLMDEAKERKLPEHNCAAMRQFMIEEAKKEWMKKNNVSFASITKKQMRKCIEDIIK